MTVKERMKGISRNKLPPIERAKPKRHDCPWSKRMQQRYNLEIERKWVELSAVLTETIMSAKNAMTGEKLHVAHEIMPKGSLRISEVTFSLKTGLQILSIGNASQCKCGWNDFWFDQWRGKFPRRTLLCRCFKWQRKSKSKASCTTPSNRTLNWTLTRAIGRCRKTYRSGRSSQRQVLSWKKQARKIPPLPKDRYQTKVQKLRKLHR